MVIPNAFVVSRSLRRERRPLVHCIVLFLFVGIGGVLLISLKPKVILSRIHVAPSRHTPAHTFVRAELLVLDVGSSTGSGAAPASASEHKTISVPVIFIIFFFFLIVLFAAFVLYEAPIRS